MDIFNNRERKIKCVHNYETRPWGSDSSVLEIGKIYTVTDIEVHSYYTIVTLKEFPDRGFSSVLFEEVEEE